jgi:LPXTG-motif cell wall-anchored protein
MVFKPTGDDTWTLVIMAAILVGAAAFFLGRARALSRLAA